MTERKKVPMSGLVFAALGVAGGLAAVYLGRAPAPARSPASAASSASANLPRTTVAIYDDGAPLVGRWVVFHGPDGAVLATMKSGADGKATGPCAPGGMVTVAYGSSIQQLVTVVGVEPNEEAIIGEQDNDEGRPGLTKTVAKISLPGPFRGAAGERAARYTVDLGVGTNDIADAAAPVRVPVIDRYLTDGGFPVLGVAYDRDGGALAYSTARALAAIDAGDTEVQLPPWQSTFDEARVELFDAPAGFRTAKVDLSLIAGEARFDHHVAPVPIAPRNSLRVKVAPGVATSHTLRVELAGTPSSRAIHLERSARRPEEPLVVRLSLATMLPRLSDAAVDRRGDVARPLLGWTESGERNDADALVLQASWPETKEHVWTVIAPPLTKPGFALPALPDELAAWRPDARAITPAVALVESTDYASYADVRKKWIHLLRELPEEDGTKTRLSITGDLDF